MFPFTSKPKAPAIATAERRVLEPEAERNKERWSASLLRGDPVRYRLLAADGTELARGDLGSPGRVTENTATWWLTTPRFKGTVARIAIDNVVLGESVIHVLAHPRDNDGLFGMPLTFQEYIGSKPVDFRYSPNDYYGTASNSIEPFSGDERDA